METRFFKIDYDGDPYMAQLPGLVGDLTSFIRDAATHPVHEIALTGALAFTAGLTGKAYNVSDTGLNLYILLLAPSGSGKEAIASGINKLTHSVARIAPEVENFIGPSDPMGGNLHRFLTTRNSSFVCIIGEAGIQFRRMVYPQASGAIHGLRRNLLDLYHKSGKSALYREVDPPVHSPAVSIIGESTPERWYANVSEILVREGLFPRFNIVEYRGSRVPLNRNRLMEPSPELVSGVASLVKRCSSLIANERHGLPIGIDPEAKTLMDDYADAVDHEIEANKHASANFWSRAHLKALRLAGLVAVGKDQLRPVIDLETARWAIAFVTKDVLNVLEHFDEGEIANQTREQQQVEETRRMCREYLRQPWKAIKPYARYEDLHETRNITEHYIKKRLSRMKVFMRDPYGWNTACDNAIAKLVELGEIERVRSEELTAKFGKAPRCYRAIAIKDPPEKRSL